MIDFLRPLHSSVSRTKLHRVRGMQRMAIPEDQREFLEAMALEIFTDMTNTGHGFQAALSAIYLSGLNHGIQASTGTPTGAVQ